MAVFPTNAYLIFQMPQRDTFIPSLGNSTLEAIPLVVEASFKIASMTGPGEENNHESRIDILQLIGRCNRVYSTIDVVEDPSNIPGDLNVFEEITPPSLPSAITPGVKVPCALVDVSTGNVRKGNFTLKNSLPSRWGVDSILGGKLNGYFFETNVMGELM